MISFRASIIFGYGHEGYVALLYFQTFAENIPVHIIESKGWIFFFPFDEFRVRTGILGSFFMYFMSLSFVKVP